MIDFDTDSFDDLQSSQEEGLVVPVHVPGTDRVLMSIRVAGPDSRQQARANERAREEFAARGSSTPLSPDEEAQVGILYLARCCMGWDATSKSGSAIPFTEDAAVELFTRYPLIRQLIDAAASNRLRFIRRSQTA